MTTPIRRKLIEVALPLESINEEGAQRKRKAPTGYPTAIHKWWAQRPVAAARAVIFAQMVDDPSSWPDLFPTKKAQEKERQRLFSIIEELVLWENTTNDEVLQRARDEIWRSWRRACSENVDHPRAKELFHRDILPAFHDPFAGGGTLPLEAQRLGLESHASDLNPVAVVINKALIELPPLFRDYEPVNPAWQSKHQGEKALIQWKGASGLAEDVRFYGDLVLSEAAKRIEGHFPRLKVTHELAQGRPDLSTFVGKELLVVAWIWARTVKSPNPAFRDVDVPLATSYLLSSKKGREVYLEPIKASRTYEFVVRTGKPSNPEATSKGTAAGKRGAFRCLMSDAPITYDYIRQEGQAGRLGSRLMAIVVETGAGRTYVSPTIDQETAALMVKSRWEPEVQLQGKARVNVSNYGLNTQADLYTHRQLLALSTFAELIENLHSRVMHDAKGAVLAPSFDPKLYADVIVLYLAFVLSRMVHHSSAICTWLPKDSAIRQTFSKQALPMTWDYVEGNPFGKSSAAWKQCLKVVTSCLDWVPATGKGAATNVDAIEMNGEVPHSLVISTDPPYYDNVSYADLSDYFYVWLRKCLKNSMPALFATMATPKEPELIASPQRHCGAQNAEHFFLEGMTRALKTLSLKAHPAYPVTIYYAFKQSETADDTGTTSTGWETFLEAICKAGFAITGTWPMRTEGDNRLLSVGANALASSIVLVCRPKDENAPTTSRRDFHTALQRELPVAVQNLQRGNVAPVDLQQAAIGPGMAVFTRFERVLDAGGKSLSVRDALAIINETLDEVLAQQEGDFDSDTRWALTWFQEYGFSEGAFGRADDLARARNTSVDGVADSGIAASGKGKVRLLRPEELPDNWDPERDKRLTVWEIVHHMIRILDKGETSAAELLAKLGSKAEIARELAYRLYSICDRTKRGQDAQRYNALVQSWPEIVAIAAKIPKVAQEVQLGFEGMNE
ncbi:MAG: DUF1156 domain-containing protein [Armatimonadetes bacterium]|nr:DUF1156 domain-containing protein [Armatimonadota bacterium]